MSAPHEDGMAPQPPDGEAERSERESGFPHDGEDDFGDLGEFAELGEILRDRLHQAVSGLEPVPGTLDYLKRAVPARRRRRHAALAATAVSVFAVSTGVALGARGTFGTGPAEAGGSNVGNLMTTATNDAPGSGSGHNPASSGGRDMGSGGSPATQAPSSLASASGSTKSTQSTTLVSSSQTGTLPAAACQSSSVASVAATQSAVSGGITYESFVATVKTACTVSGLPNLTVTGGNGQSAKIPVFLADQAAAPLLPSVPAGLTLGFQPGDRFEFQLAWVPSACDPNPTPTTPASSVPTSTDSPTVTATPSGPTPSGPTSSASGQPTPSGTPPSSSGSSKAYSVSYALGGSQTAQSVSFTADCGAVIYVTDYFAAGQRHAGQQLPTRSLSSSD